MVKYGERLINKDVDVRELKLIQNSKEIESFYKAMNVPELIQEAERLRIHRKIHRAIAVLKIAQEKMFSKNEKRMDYLLKYPIYLQLGDQIYTGWMEFFEIKKHINNLLNEELITKSEYILAESKISNVMGFFQEKREEFPSAINYYIKSYFEELKFIKNIIKNEEIKLEIFKNNEESLIIKEQAERYYEIKSSSFQYVSILSKILLRCDSLKHLEKLYKIVSLNMIDVENVDFVEMGNEIEAVFK